MPLPPMPLSSRPTLRFAATATIRRLAAARWNETLRSPAAVLVAATLAAAWVGAPATAQPPAPQAEISQDTGEEYSAEEMQGYSEAEMMGYEDEMMSGSVGGRSRGGSAAEVFSASMGNAFSSLFSAESLMSLAAPAEQSGVIQGPVLEKEARTAYASGDYVLALNLLYGHIVAEYDQAHNAIQLAKFSRLMKRPAWQLRWGISYALRGDSADPSPIEESANPRGGGGFGPGEFAE